MITDPQLSLVKGKDVSCHYDLATKKVVVRFGEAHEDEEAADFFGNGLKKGEPAGLAFHGVSSYTTSNGDHIQLGRLIDILAEGDNRCQLHVTNGDVPNMAGNIAFQFQRVELIYA